MPRKKIDKKQVYVISGANGAGKTTSAKYLLTKFLDIKEFVNADEIARGLSPFQPEKVSFQAGRIMLERIDELLKQRVNCRIMIVFLWLCH